MMISDSENWRPQGERDNMFSRTVKAGKRVYYFDVKRDRRDEYYIAMTESKRVQEGTETERPVFEKHKIFLYREDIINFLSALTDAAQYIGDHRPLTVHERREYRPSAAPAGHAAPAQPVAPAAPAAPTAGYAAVPEATGVQGPIDKIDLGDDFEIDF